jgi:hypothetical protein
LIFVTYLTESKETDMLMSRIEALNGVKDYIGIHYSLDWVRKSILRQTEDEIKQMHEWLKKKDKK